MLTPIGRNEEGEMEYIGTQQDWDNTPDEFFYQNFAPNTAEELREEKLEQEALEDLIEKHENN